MRPLTVLIELDTPAKLPPPDLLHGQGLPHSFVEVGEERDAVRLEVAEDGEAVAPGHAVRDLERLDHETGRRESRLDVERVASPVHIRKSDRLEVHLIEGDAHLPSDLPVEAGQAVLVLIEEHAIEAPEARAADDTAVPESVLCLHASPPGFTHSGWLPAPAPDAGEPRC